MTDLPDVIVITDEQSDVSITVEAPAQAPDITIAADAQNPDVIIIEVPDSTPDVITVTDDQAAEIVTIEVPSQFPAAVTIEAPPLDPDVITIDTGWEGPPGKSYEVAPWTHMGTIIPTTEPTGAWVYPTPHELLSIQLSITEPPIGADVVVDLNVNGASVFTDQADRPRILDGERSGLVNFSPAILIGAAEAMTVDIDEVGSTSPGRTLVVIVRSEAV